MNAPKQSGTTIRMTSKINITGDNPPCDSAGAKDWLEDRLFAIERQDADVDDMSGKRHPFGLLASNKARMAELEKKEAGVGHCLSDVQDMDRCRRTIPALEKEAKIIRKLLQDYADKKDKVEAERVAAQSRPMSLRKQAEQNVKREMKAKKARVDARRKARDAAKVDAEVARLKSKAKA